MEWQPALPFQGTTLTTECWQAALAQRLGCRVQVEYSRARSTPVQVRWQGVLRVKVHVRLHEMFADAPEEVVEALASWIKVGKRARRRSELLDRWLEHRLKQLPPKKPRRVRLRSRGQHHDLGELAAGLLGEEFVGDFSEGRTVPRITWGRRGRSRSSLQLGSFDPETRVVRVHPVLDREDVPSWYVRAVLFHELLHAALPSQREQGRRCVHHGPEFRARERAYGDHERAVKWEKRNLSRLIRLTRKITG